MKKNIRSFATRRPQYTAADIATGVVRAIIVSARDPNLTGGARATAYGMDGDYKNLDIDSLKWARPALGLAGSFSAFELYDRVLLAFDSGDKDSVPLIVGKWEATPMGRENSLCHNKRLGSEIRPEAWHHHDLYPESIVLASSRNGNTIWMNDIWMDETNLASSLNLMDVYAKYFRIRSHKSNVRVWSPEQDPPKGVGGLYQHSPSGDNVPIRYGWENPDTVEEASGSIEMGFKDLVHNLVKGEDGFTCDDTTQGERVERCISGQAYQHSVNGSGIAMHGGNLFLDGNMGIFATSPILMAPKRWDI